MARPAVAHIVEIDEPGQVENVARRIESVGTDTKEAAEGVASSWAPIAGAYSAPEAPQVHTAMNTPRDRADDLAGSASRAAGVLNEYAGALKNLQERRTRLIDDVALSAQMHAKVSDLAAAPQMTADLAGPTATELARTAAANFDSALSDRIAKFNADVAEADRQCASGLGMVSGNPAIYVTSATLPLSDRHVVIGFSAEDHATAIATGVSAQDAAAERWQREVTELQKAAEAQQAEAEAAAREAAEREAERENAGILERAWLGARDSVSDGIDIVKNFATDADYRAALWEGAKSLGSLGWTAMSAQIGSDEFNEAWGEIWGMAKESWDTFWEDPAYGIGGLLPDLLVGVATAGVGGVAFKGARTGANLLDRAAGVASNRVTHSLARAGSITLGGTVRGVEALGRVSAVAMRPVTAPMHAFATRVKPTSVGRAFSSGYQAVTNTRAVRVVLDAPSTVVEKAAAPFASRIAAREAAGHAAAMRMDSASYTQHVAAQFARPGAVPNPQHAPAATTSEVDARVAQQAPEASLSDAGAPASAVSPSATSGARVASESSIDVDRAALQMDRDTVRVMDDIQEVFDDVLAADPDLRREAARAGMIDAASPSSVRPVDSSAGVGMQDEIARGVRAESSSAGIASKAGGDAVYGDARAARSSTTVMDRPSGSDHTSTGGGGSGREGGSAHLGDSGYAGNSGTGSRTGAAAGLGDSPAQRASGGDSESATNDATLDPERADSDGPNAERVGGHDRNGDTQTPENPRHSGAESTTEAAANKGGPADAALAAQNPDVLLESPAANGSFLRTEGLPDSPPPFAHDPRPEGVKVLYEGNAATGHPRVTQFTRTLSDGSKVHTIVSSEPPVPTKVGGSDAPAGVPDGEVPGPADLDTDSIKNVATFHDRDGLVQDINFHLTEVTRGVSKAERLATNTINSILPSLGKKPLDVGGHYVGHRFLPGPATINIFPQAGKFNGSGYLSFENEMSAWIRKHHTHIEGRITPRYPNQDQATQRGETYESYSKFPALPDTKQYTVGDRRAEALRVSMRAVRDDLPAAPRNLEDLEFMNDDTQGFERAHRREMLIRLELAKAGIDFDKLPTDLQHQLLRRRTPSTPALTTEIVAAINALETTGTNP